jgi:uncharacterized membrane protein
MHAIAVHFVVALTASSFAFDILGVLLQNQSLAASGWWTLALAAPATVVALISGAVSRRRVPMAEGTARRFLRLHMALGPIFSGLIFVLGVWRWRYWASETFPSLWYMAGLAGSVLTLTVQGYLGGELVYRFGVEVRGTYPRLDTTDLRSAGTDITRQP